jgi:hypothetical protein
MDGKKVLYSLRRNGIGCNGTNCIVTLFYVCIYKVYKVWREEKRDGRER